MVVDYLSSQPNWAGYQVSTKQGSGPSGRIACNEMVYNGVVLCVRQGVTTLRFIALLDLAEVDTDSA